MSTPTLKQRPPLAVLPNGSVSPPPPANGVTRPPLPKRTVAELNAALNDEDLIPMEETATGDSPFHKKSRRSTLNKRVSFGGSHIRVYDQHAEEWPSAKRESSGKSKRAPAAVTAQSPSPRRSPRLRKVAAHTPPVNSLNPTTPASYADEGGDGDGDDGDTVTLPELPTNSSPATGRRFSDAIDVFVDEDVTRGIPEMRLSIVGGGGGEDTTINVKAPELRHTNASVHDDENTNHINQNISRSASPRRKDSPSSITSDDDDITQGMPGLGGLLADDEVGDSPIDDATKDNGAQPGDGGDSSPGDPCLGIAESAQRRDSFDNAFGQLFGSDASEDNPNTGSDFDMHDITAQLPNMSALLNDDGDSDSPQDATHESEDTLPLLGHPVQPTGRESVGDITSGIPSIAALTTCDASSEDLVTVSAVKNSVRKSPRPPKPVPTPAAIRPNLPESRRLFNCDENAEEDTTIHYHDQNVTVSPVSKPSPHHPASVAIASAQQQSPMLSTLSKTVSSSQVAVESSTATPKSATASKILAVVTGRSASRGQGSVSRTQVISSETHLRGVPAPVSQANSLNSFASHQESASVSDFRIAEFLEASNIRFNDDLGQGLREASLAGGVVSPFEGDRDSLQAQIVSSVMSFAVLSKLNEAVQTVQTQIAGSIANIASLEAQIEQTCPPVFAKMAKSNELLSTELTTVQVGLKRLRKISALEAREEWVAARHVREKDMLQSLRSKIDGLHADMSFLTESERAMANEHESLQADIGSHGLDLEVEKCSRGQVNEENLANMRVQVKATFSDIEALQVSIVEANETAAAKEREGVVLRQEQKHVDAECGHLNSFASAGTPSKLSQMLTEQRRLNSFASSATGIEPLKLTEKEVSLRLVGILYVTFTVHESVVTHVETRAITLQSPASAVMCSFVEHITTLAAENCLKPVGLLSELQYALHLAVDFLSYAKDTYIQVVRYAERNEVTVASCELSAETATVDMRILASYYSLKKKCKFDVSLVLSLSAPSFKGSAMRQSIRIDSIDSIIGEAPSVAELDAIVQKAGFVSGKDRFNVLVALSSIWTLLR